ncbi:MAG: glycosyltransferase family 39 protein, partial [Caldilineaceae bacterium]
VAVALMARLAAELRPLASHAHQQAEPRDWPPVWAATLLALHPLVLYYAQEARMYALLLMLSLAAAVTLSPGLQRTMAPRRWMLYTLLGTLALYTHYFAAFVLLAFALAWLWPVAGRTRQWIPFVLAHGTMALLYAPWAVIMVRRLGDDASYWQGRLKLGEAIAETAGRFVAGETMAEPVAQALAIVVLIATAAGLFFLWRGEPSRRPALRLALLWLLTPLVAVLGLASFAPKFNVRYVFAALPGLALIWSMLGAHLVAPETRTEPRMRTIRVIGLMFIAGLLGVFIWSTVNWHTQPRFAKAQWRQLTEFLRPRLAPEESVFLVSGHAWPVWDYYAPDIPVTRLPEIDELDVNQVLDFATTGAPLRAAIADTGGAWLVAWQDEVVDPNEVVP